MSKKDKLIQKIKKGQDISFSEAESLLVSLGFMATVKGSHHTFRHADGRRITIVYRTPFIHRDAVRELARLL